MKLISDYLNRLKIIILFTVFALEMLLFVIVINLYRPIYKKTFEITKNHTINKTISATKTLNEIIKITLYRYLCDLKLIGKHMSFLGNEENDSKYIKRSSNYYKNILINEDKKIVYGSMEELKKIKELEKFYNEEKEKYDYISIYNKEYIDTGKQSKIINYLVNKSMHPELNMIAYYKSNNSHYNISLLNENKIRAAKYIISILKTNFIRRFITRGINYEFMNYFLFIEDEMYIYPPEAFNNTHIFSFSQKNSFDCKNNTILYNFPKCIYTYMNNPKNNFVSEIPGFFRPSLFESKLEYDEISINFCLNIPFEKDFDLINLSYNPFLCMEMNFTKFFYNNNFEQKEAFEFLLFIIDLEEINDIIPIYNHKKEKYEEIKNVFKDEKFKKYTINPNQTINKVYSLFHFLYIDIFKDPNSLYNLKCSVEDIINEYEEIKTIIFQELTKFSNNISYIGGNEDGIELEINSEYKVIDIEKTVCKNDIYNNNMTCLKDTFLFIIYPIYGNFSLVNDYFLEDQRFPVDLPLFFSLSIISNNNNYMDWKIKNIMRVKIMKLFLFYLISSISVIFIYFILVQLFYEIKYNLINEITNIIGDGRFFEIKDKNEILQKKELISLRPNNKDMAEIKNLFDHLVKAMILKFNFEEKKINCINNDVSFNNKMKKIKNIKNSKNKNNNNSNLDNFSEFMDLIKNQNNPETKIMCLFIIAYVHFKEGYFKLAENEFKNLLLEINAYERKISNKNEDSDSKLKDSISRCSKISYLNEYSLTNEMNETTLPIIKAKLLKQKILYLYAFCIYNQEKTKNSSININNVNENKKNNKELVKKRFEEAIKYFSECRNISTLLGTDTIREIFSLIMISKCYIELKDYKESMININEALLLFSDLQKSFKDKNFFDPKIMLFAENFIFQSIMLSIAQTTFICNKIPESCWILMKIIETSPFIYNNIHHMACFMLNNCLRQMESNSNIAPRQIDKYRKNINKIFARINIRMLNKEKLINKELKLNTNITATNITSNPSIANTQVNSLSVPENHGSNLKRLINKKDIYTNKVNSTSMSSSNPFYRNKNKNITLCISEKIIMNINGEELKDVLIKFYQKCFSNSTDDDKFGFIQFSCNGKKTISIRSEPLDYFLQKLESNKGAFQLNENYNKSTNEIQFMEFSNLFFSIIKSQKQQNIEDRCDHIIIIFINTEDIRFNGKKECVDTINELNSNNYTLIIFTYDTNISCAKIDSIHSFLCGLNDGHFFQIKNYQQIKQVLMNFSIKESQEKFVNYDYEITDYML